jgi:hypothetical protein
MYRVSTEWLNYYHYTAQVVLGLYVISICIQALLLDLASVPTETNSQQ